MSAVPSNIQPFPTTLDDLVHQYVNAKQAEEGARKIRVELEDRILALVPAKQVATDDRTRFTASVESVTFKDGVKAVLTMPNTQASHELADTAGGRVYVVIEDPSRYTLDSSATPKSDPDQPDLGA
jgi:hypothetical protein